MKPRNKNLIILLAILIIAILAGSIYAFAFQRKEISKQKQMLTVLRKSYSNTEALKSQLKEIEKSEGEMDAMLASYPVNIPNSIPEEKFYDFINRYSQEYFVYTGASVEFKEKKSENGINYYVYKVYGTGRFTDVYNLIYAIEHSRELKKIESAEVKANTVVNSAGIPKYLASFNFLVDVYFADNDLFIPSNYVENNLEREAIYNAFYPLIRNEIPANTEDLPDIQNASLISLVPQGAFIKVNQGDTFLMEKGDPVYLGVLTDIDYTAGTATFTLNKGGLIEEVVLQLGNKKNRGK